MSVTTVTTILNALRAHKGMAIDDQAPNGTELRLTHVAIVKTAEDGECVIPVFKKMCFPPNPIEVDERGVPHITSKRLGKIMDSREIQIQDLPGHDPNMSLVVEV